MHIAPANMEANQSIKSSMIHHGLSAEKEEAVRKFYQNFLRIMGSASEYGLAFQFVFQMTVTPASPEEMPSAILDVSASAAVERAEDMEERHKREMAEAVEKAWEEGAMDGVYDAEEKHAKALADMEKQHAKALADMEKRHQELRMQDNAKYAKCLAPLIDIRDKMRAECDKKCQDAEREGHATGYACSDQRWNPMYKAVCEELELVRKEGYNHLDAYIRVCKERDELVLKEVDLRQELDEMAEDSEKLEAHVEALRMELASAKGKLEGTEVAERAVTASATEVIEGLRKELTTTKMDLIRVQNAAEKLQGEVDSATQLFQVMRSDLERLNAENKALKKKNEALLELVGPAQKLMTSKPELFGGEALPPLITRWRAVSEEETERAEKFLKDLAVLSRPCQLVESPPSALPGVEKAETEGLCRAWRECDNEEALVPDQSRVCGAAGCIECPPAAEPKPEAKKPNYNHPNWPSPITKRFAKHLAKHSGKTDPKSIKTHEDALEYIANRSNISVETLLQWTMKHYQSFSEPWTLVEGPHKFNMGTAPATWWC